MSVKRITGPTTAEGVAERWREQYQNADGTWRYDDEKRAIYERLVALGPTPVADAVDAVIGNESWTKEWCAECSEYFRDGFQLGQEPDDYDSATVTICDSCAKKYVTAIRSGLRASPRGAPE